ncbi:TPA: imidazole glycerol phosphate synthase subunit HisH [Candidatus Bathyarchaeota archaeon]|nr:imidazole glycerol phosphate synthase subunit HisH [Candidatus Bathyarchaeota archaeon]
MVVDYGVGNLRSVAKGLRRAGADPFISEDLGGIRHSDAIVFPGVGAFDAAMAKLGKALDVVEEAIERAIPILGICLGMHIMLVESEEGGSMGLSVVRGRAVRLPGSVKVPHMGWNTIEVRRRHPLVAGIDEGDCFYFAHSYAPLVEEQGNVVATTRYGIEFASVMAKGNVFGVQFHPEKSGESGRRILMNFVDIVRGAL